MNIVNKFSKEAITYGFGFLISRSIIILLIPVYTRIFTPTEYGRIELLLQIGLLVGEFISLGMDSAQSLYFNKEKKNGLKAQSILISSIFQLRIIWGFFLIFLISIFSNYINLFFFQGELSYRYFIILFAGVIFSQLTSQSAEVFRLRYKPTQFVLLTSLRIIIEIPFIIYFVLKLKLGIFGYLLGTTLGYLIASIFSIYKIKNYLSLDKIHNFLWPKVLKFGLPLSIASIIFYLMNTADRFFIDIYRGEYELGLYSVAAKLSLIISGFVYPFRNAWWPWAMDLIYKKNGNRLISEMSKIYLGISLTIMMVLSYLSPFIIRLFTTEEYYDSWKLIGILTWPIICFGFYSICSVGIWKSEKTFYSITTNFSAAILGIILNFILVPKFGSMGAALATGFTFTFWVILNTFLTYKLENIILPNFILICQASISIMFLYFSIIKNPFLEPISCLIALIISSSICIFLGLKDRLINKEINS